MPSPEMAERFDTDLKRVERAHLKQILGGTWSPDYHTLIAEFSELEEEDMEGGAEVYYTNEPPHSQKISFPRLLSGRSELVLSAEDLESEIGLILEMRTGEDFDNGTALYSVTARQPQPFAISEDWLPELPKIPHSALSNARAGYLVHDDLYALQSDPNKLHDLVSIFLDDCNEVEVKLKSWDDSMWRVVTVRLTH